MPRLLSALDLKFVTQARYLAYLVHLCLNFTFELRNITAKDVGQRDSSASLAGAG